VHEIKKTSFDQKLGFDEKTANALLMNSLNEKVEYLNNIKNDKNNINVGKYNNDKKQ